MKPAKLLSVFLVLALAGGAGLFYYQTTLPDHEGISQDVTERLLLIDGLDSSISEFSLRSRFNLDQNYDRLARASLLLDKEMADLQATYFADDNPTDSILQRSFEEYKNEIEVKKDLVENFKSHNSVLRNSEKYAPAAGQELMDIADKENLPEVSALYNELVKELLEYSLLGSSNSVEKIKLIMPRLAVAEEAMPDYALTALIEFTNHVNTVIREKEETDRYLSKALSSTSDDSMNGMSQAWSDWVVSKKQVHDEFNMYVLGYILFLLASVAFITWKLRSLYQSLDHEVEIRTQEAKHAYEELQESETQLVQTEKMASLGQLVAGVAHEINTPLGYISSNVDTIRLNMGELDSIIGCVDKISTGISSKTMDKKALGGIIKQMVIEYRNMRKRETLSEIEGLLKDSSYGLNEISELVSSLKDFSRLDRANVAEADLHAGLDATIKICANELGQRHIEKTYEDELPMIECMPAQLNQVFMNVLTNAAQATDESSGVIKITTQIVGGGVEIDFEDNGEGMDEETMKSVFNPFYTTKEIGKGTGLGMSIAYKIIKSHGGSIEVDSTLGQGTKVTIKLPLHQALPELSVIK